MAGFSPVAGAVDFGEAGTVEIYAALAVTEDTQLDFGIVSNNDGTITLGLADLITSDPSLIHVSSSVELSGDYSITGEAAQTVAVTIAGSTSGGVTIDNFNTNLGAPPLAGVVLPAALVIGADLTLSSATVGVKVLNFTLGITYE